MQFLWIQAILPPEEAAEGQRRPLCELEDLYRKQSVFNLAHKGLCGFFLDNRLRNGTLKTLCLTTDADAVEQSFADYLQTLELWAEYPTYKEVTLNEFVRRLERIKWRETGRQDVANVRKVLEEFHLERTTLRSRTLRYDERMIPQLSRSAQYEAVEELLAYHTFLPELDRIYEDPPAPQAGGIPVDYFLQDSGGNSTALLPPLMNALLARKRVQNRRVGIVTFSRGITPKEVETMLGIRLQLNEGGTLLVRTGKLLDKNGNIREDAAEVLKQFCRIARTWNERVLLIFQASVDGTQLLSLLQEQLGSKPILPLVYDGASSEEALKYLYYLAGKSRLKPDLELENLLEKDKEYNAAALRKLYCEWQDRKLRKELYPQYQVIPQAGQLAARTQKGKAYQQLQHMVGLTEAKETLDRILQAKKAETLYASLGMEKRPATLHSVFYGPPGTCKTTVARLWAQIFKDNGILERNCLVEVDRSKLVARHVGGTAPLVRQRFQQAKGGILLIDECYSLVDSRNGSFGDEAITEIVKMMDECRQDTVVIFTGYPDRIQEFMSKNPGLRSRISYHISFPDYTPAELSEMAARMLADKGLELVPQAQDKLEDICRQAVYIPDFGNGRFVRSLLEQARMRQAMRLLEMDPKRVGHRELTTLMAEDLELPAVFAGEAARKSKIGFVDTDCLPKPPLCYAEREAEKNTAI